MTAASRTALPPLPPPSRIYDAQNEAAFRQAIERSLQSLASGPSGAISFGDDVAVAGDATIKGDLDVTGDATIEGDLDVTGDVTYGGQQSGAIFANGDLGATPVIDWANGDKQKGTLSANATITFATPKDGAVYVLHLLEDATGGWTITLPSSVVWDSGTTPTWVTTAGHRRIIVFTYDAATSKYYAASFGLSFAS